MITIAELASRSERRLRLRFSARRGDQIFFDDLVRRWQKEFPVCQLVGNPLTGSLLVTGDVPAPEAIGDFGRRLALFELMPPVLPSRSWIGIVERTLTTLNCKIQRGSHGALDLTGALFAALILFGISELLRGNWKSPPWYTVFWYAFGVYSKVLLDQAAVTGD